MEHYVKDKVVVITGGSSGFGYEAARMLLEMGASVVITGRNAEKLAAAEAQLASDRLLAVRADAVSTADWQRLVSAVQTRFGRIDVLVNNHGAGVKIDNLEALTDEEIETILAINLTSVIKGCREVIAVMKSQGSGHIINVSSACAHRGWAAWATYTAAKAGMVGFTRSLHREMCVWGGKASNFVPGAAKTSFCEAAQIDTDWQDGYPEAHEFARTLVHCVDLPDSCVMEEVRVWGIKQVNDMLDPY
jgi:NAD(P)-dependent dehydrogenase (short-subunit alcohol dehydrogenase family)